MLISVQRCAETVDGEEGLVELVGEAVNRGLELHYEPTAQILIYVSAEARKVVVADVNRTSYYQSAGRCYVPRKR